MSNSEQLERQAEQCREEIADTLAELRGRMTPGQIVDQVVDYARDSGGGDFFRNLQRQVVSNPLPLALVGASLAWLMMGTRADGARAGSASGIGRGAGEFAQAAADSGRSLYDQAGDAASTARERAGDMAESARRTAQDWSDAAGAAGASTYGHVRGVSERLRGLAGSTSDGIRDATSSAYDSAADAARKAADGMRSTTSSLRDGAARAGQTMFETLKSQPLVLAGIGLAIGAAIGAMLPSSETEDRLMGDASDELKERVQDVAAEQYDKSKSVAERVYEDVKQELEKQGLASGSAEKAHADAARGSVETEAPDLVPAAPHDEETRKSELSFAESERDRGGA
jgi:hypothetical protein